MLETLPSSNGGLDDIRPPVIEAFRVDAGYNSVPVIRGLSLFVGAGEIVALLGANGAGKSTTVRVLAGELKPMAGQVRMGGTPVTTSLQKRARLGLRLIPEERSVFMSLSVADNLRLGGQSRRDVLEIFPELGRLMRRKAGLLSGGEQQMLTLGRALAARPSVLLIDELSLGLAPMIVDRLLDKVRNAANEGAGILLVEQHIRRALEIADRGYVIRRGQIVLQGAASDLLARIAEIETNYLAEGDLGEGGLAEGKHRAGEKD
jgi:branched-chain amino acid transport system ATP-binding protein